MDQAYLDLFFDMLRQKGIAIERGLSDAEILAVEEKYHLHFPPDLKQLLQHALPVGSGFPDWRNGSEESIRFRLDGPLDGICFDIEYNRFWWPTWGPQPTQLADAFEVARKAIANVPTLIPVYGHRYIPSEPAISGNPVFSVVQTDIIYYGNDLPSYFKNDFGVPCPVWIDSAKQPRRIPFWSEIVS